MQKPTRWYRKLKVDATGDRVMSYGGSVLLAATTEAVVAGGALSAALGPWRKPRAVHDPGKVLLDLAVAAAIGGDCLGDIASLRAEPAVFGRVASDPTVSRMVDILAVDVDLALKRSTSPGPGSGRSCEN